MSFFGNYLISLNIISVEDLVDCLVEQTKHTPSSLEAALRSEALNQSQILKVLDRQAKDNSSFQNASKELGLWSPEVETKVMKYSSERRKPLGQILVEKKKID